MKQLCEKQVAPEKPHAWVSVCSSGPFKGSSLEKLVKAGSIFEACSSSPKWLRRIPAVVPCGVWHSQNLPLLTQVREALGGCSFTTKKFMHKPPFGEARDAGW